MDKEKRIRHISSKRCVVKMKKKKYIIVAIVLIGILAITGISYAVWQLTHIQETTNVVNSTCFKIEFEDQDNIELQNTYPMKDEVGMKLNPYTFTIRNICNTNATYQINLEELQTELKRLSSEYIKVSLNESSPKLLNTYPVVEKTIESADTSHKLTTGVLKSNEEKTFTLRLWMDYDTPAIEEVMEATMISKITIITVQKNEIPEVEIIASDNLNEITVDISTVSNPKNEELIYYYQLNNEEEIESTENTHTFTNLEDGKYRAIGRAETKDGIILEEKISDITIAYEKVYVSNTGNDETGNGSIETPYASLNPAYNKVKSGGEIILLSDITATETANFNIENKEVTLRSNGDSIYTIIKAPSFTTQILDIQNGNTVTTTNITFDGNEVISSTALIESHDSILNLNKNTTISNSINNREYNGAGIMSINTMLTMNDVTIINNQVTGTHGQGGGVEEKLSTILLRMEEEYI